MTMLMVMIRGNLVGTLAASERAMARGKKVEFCTCVYSQYKTRKRKHV